MGVGGAQRLFGVNWSLRLSGGNVLTAQGVMQLFTRDSAVKPHYIKHNFNNAR